MGFAFLDSAKRFIKEQAGNVKKFMNKDTIEGAGCAFAKAALANGEVKPEEKQAITKELTNSEALGEWAIDIVKAFEAAIPKLKSGSFVAETEVAQKIAKIPKASPDAPVAGVIIATCISIGAADGDFDDDEKKVVKALANDLGVDLEPYAALFV